MRLTELDPRWVGIRDVHLRYALSFLCPHCKEIRLVIRFKPYMDPDNWGESLVEIDPKYHVWTRTGENFETLTLSPSIDASADKHWHGFITNGNIT